VAGTLHEVMAGLGSATSARDLKIRVMDEVAEPFGAGATGLYLFGPDRGVVELHTRGVRDGFILAYEQMGRGDDPILERAIRTGEPTHDGTVFEGDRWTRSRLYRECGGPWKIQHYLCAPIVIGGEVVGTLNLGRRDAGHPFGPREVAWANAIRSQIAARLLAFAREPEDPPPRTRSTVEDLGRLSAERTQVRIHVDAMERRAVRLADDEAGALWEAVASRHITPLDYFEKGDRTYVLLSSPEPAPTVAGGRLTRRESEVVSWVAAGFATKEIAFELDVSPNTVGALLTSARNKLGVRSRVKLVEIARRLGLVR
jgi:DNA-binding CsgD family transcriptional regulator